MKANIASLINSFALIILGFWGLIEVNENLFSGEIINKTPLIPISIGFLILLCNNGIKNNNKLIAHIAVFLTFISLANLMPLWVAISEGRDAAAIRVGLMVLSSIFALVYFIKSFISNRAEK